MLADERAEARRVFFADRVALGLQLLKRGVEVEGGPQHDGVEMRGVSAQRAQQLAEGKPDFPAGIVRLVLPMPLVPVGRS